MGDGENPSMGDGEMSMAGGEHHKISNVKHYCRLQMIGKYVSGYSPRQTYLVHELGAGFVFSMGTKMPLNSYLMNFLIRCFRCDKEALEIEKGAFIEIRPVRRICIICPILGRN